MILWSGITYMFCKRFPHLPTEGQALLVEVKRQATSNFMQADVWVAKQTYLQAAAGTSVALNADHNAGSER